MEMSKIEASIFDAFIGTSFGKESDVIDLATYITGSKKKASNIVSYRNSLNKELLNLLTELIVNVEKGNSTLTKEDLAIITLHTDCTLGIGAGEFPEVLSKYNVPYCSESYWGISKESTELVKEQTLDIFNNVKVF